MNWYNDTRSKRLNDTTSYILSRAKDYYYIGTFFRVIKNSYTYRVYGYYGDRLRDVII